jgi:hypothetical protein
MKKLLILVLVLTASMSLNAQKIEMTKVFGGYTFKQDGKNLLLKDMQEIMKDNKEAFDLVQSAKSNQTWSMVLGGIGGGLIGFPIGTAIGGGDPEWALLGAGAAILVATIPIVKGFNRKTSKAVQLYNDGITSNGYKFNPTLDLNLKGNGIGLTMSF